MFIIPINDNTKFKMIDNFWFVLKIKITNK